MGVFPLEVVANMHRIAVVGLLAVLIVGAVSAQAPVALPPQEDPYIRELVRRSRGSNAMLAISISDALNIKLDDLASGFLASLAGRKVDVAETATLARRILPAQLFRVTVESQFNEAAKTQAAAMLEALRTIDQSSERILPAIANLSSLSPEERLPALRIVLAGGDESVALLSTAAAKATDTPIRDELLRVMLRLGDGGPAAIRQLAIYGDDTIRAGALKALIRLGVNHTANKRAKPVVVAAALDPNATPQEKATAQSWLKRYYSGLPSHEDAERFMLDQLASQQEAIGNVNDQDATIQLWTIGDDLLSVKHAPVRAIDAARREVIDQVRLLHRLGTLSEPARDAGIAADLSYRFQLDPLGIRESRAEIVRLWGEESVSVPGLARLIETTIEIGDFTSAIAAIQLLDESMDDDADLLMSTHSEVRTPLVVAASHPIPRLRYEAAAAIARLGYTRAYAGSSEVMRRWIEMTSLAREPIVLLVGTRIELEGQIERILASMGYRVEIVSSVRDAVAAVDRGGDLRFMISTTVLPDRSAMELVDAVRRRPLGVQLPIILHGMMDKVVDGVTNDVRLPTPVIHVELPGSAAGWSLILDPIEADRLLPSLSAVERFDFRRAGTNALGQIASKPDTFGFYDFDKLAGVQVSGGATGSDSATVAFGEPLLAVLSVAASRDAQSTLVDLTIRAGTTSERREAASRALLSSIERNGVLLERGDLLRLSKTQQALDDKSRAVIDQVLAEIGRRSDLTGVEFGSTVKIDASKQTEPRVSPPDI